MVRTITATEASRGFSDLLDAVERGETVRIKRKGGVVAEISPAGGSTFGALKTALRGVPPLDDGFESDIAEALSLVTEPEVPSWGAA